MKPIKDKISCQLNSLPVGNLTAAQDQTEFSGAVQWRVCHKEAQQPLSEWDSPEARLAVAAKIQMDWFIQQMNASRNNKNMIPMIINKEDDRQIVNLLVLRWCVHWRVY